MRKNLDIIIAYTIMLGLIILVGFLQAYVFALLTAVFIGMAVNVHH